VTYRNDGELVGFPFFKGYGQRKLDLALARCRGWTLTTASSSAASRPKAPRCWNTSGRRPARSTAGGVVPEGRVQLTAGWLQHQTRANWKLLAENETDGYHPQFVHGSIFGVTGSTIGPLYSDSSTAVTRDLGNGHSENDLRPEFRKFAEPMRWFGTTESRVPGYAAAMRAKYGDEAESILIEGAPHVMVFPNLFIAEIQVFKHSTGLGR